MRRGRLDSIMRWCRGWQALSTRRVKGQIALYMAVLLTSLMGLAGAGVDYGLIVIESSRLQNGLDAASLAGARELVTSNASTQALRNSAADTKAIEFLTLHNYTVGSLGTEVTETSGGVTATCRTGSTTSATFKFCRSASDGGSFNDTMKVTGTIVKPTSFWKAIGINSTTLNQSSTAVSSGGMVDVMLSLDLSLSMEYSGGDDLPDLRDAVGQFLDQMQLSLTNTRGSQVGIARWAGLKCGWYRSDGDRYVDLDRGPNGLDGTPSEAYSPCTEDKTVLSRLTMDEAKLLKIAKNDPTAGACPAGPDVANISGFACSLKSWRYGPNQYTRVAGTPIPVPTPQTATNFQTGNSGTESGMAADLYSATGTRIPNAITAVNDPVSGYYAWGNSYGGRNGQDDVGYARKVLVIMTDGFNQAPPTGIPSGYANGLPSAWNTEMKTLATALKRGPDNTPGTVDDVEIYVVAFMCTPYSSSSSELNWCRSQAAGIIDANGKHPCPNGVKPTSNSIMSTLDNDLNDVSSSATGTCTHYFPISKTIVPKESLPQLFRVIAGSIARGRLQ